MTVSRKHAGFRAGVILPCLVLCLAFAVAGAEQSHAQGFILANDTMNLVAGGTIEESVGPAPFTVITDNNAGLDFDLAGSETRKLQLLLNQPLTLSAGTDARVLDNGGDLLGLDATLNVPLNNSFELAAGVNRQIESARFQSLGSVRCMNGTLRADSYTASGCRFVDEPLASTELNRFNLGARMNIGNATGSINWFTQDSEVNALGARRPGGPGGQAVMGNSLLSPNLGNPLMNSGGYDPLQYLNSEASGVNLNFKVGISTDTRGDVRLGLAFTRVLEADYQGLYSGGSDMMSWTLAEPFNTAAMDLEWKRGAFSTNIQGFYRESVDFLDRNSVDGLTTFDVHFTWRTPWNANLSVGASNILNAGADQPASTDSQPVDPFESIYGRIPYVRYKQDL